MTTTEYFPISPIGEGTTEIEVLGSLLCRMAKVHSVSLYAFSNHLERWWTLNHPDDAWSFGRVVNGRNPMFCGTGTNVAKYVEMLIQGTGCPSIGTATFQELRSAISSYGHGVCRLGRAWCPACLHEANASGTPFYDRLIWAIPLIKRCRHHRVALENSCASCGAFQLHYNHLGFMEKCFRCKAPLHQAPSDWQPMLEPTLYENECYQLVEAIACHQLAPIVPDAYKILLKRLVGTVNELRREFGPKSHLAAAIGTSVVRDGGRPKLTTLLKRCAVLSLNPAHVIQDPVGAADSICLLDLAQLDLPAERKPKRPQHLADLAEERMRTAMKSSDFDLTPSLRAVAKELGVSVGFLRYRLSALCTQYGHFRRHSGGLKYIQTIDRATTYLLSGPVLEYPSPRFPSHDHLAAAAAKEVGAGVRIGRLAADAALKKHLGSSAYGKYRRASGLHVPRPRANANSGRAVSND